MIGPIRVTLAMFRYIISAAAYDAPAFVGKSLYGGVSDSTACAGQDDGFSLIGHLQFLIAAVTISPGDILRTLPGPGVSGFRRLRKLA